MPASPQGSAASHGGTDGGTGLPWAQRRSSEPTPSLRHSASPWAGRQLETCHLGGHSPARRTFGSVGVTSLGPRARREQQAPRKVGAGLGAVGTVASRSLHVSWSYFNFRHPLNQCILKPFPSSPIGMRRFPGDLGPCLQPREPGGHTVSKALAVTDMAIFCTSAANKQAAAGQGSQEHSTLHRKGRQTRLCPQLRLQAAPGLAVCPPQHTALAQALLTPGPGEADWDGSEQEPAQPPQDATPASDKPALLWEGGLSGL